MNDLRLPLAAIALCGACTVFVPASSVEAQTAAPGALPTAPGAERAGEGGLTQAQASLPGAPGSSPLEPYLVTWLLPVSGMLTVAAGSYVDRRVRMRSPRRVQR